MLLELENTENTDKGRDRRMRRKDREITDFEEMLKIMQRCDVCRVAWNDPSGYPYILPLNFGIRVEEEKVKLYFHGATEGRKYELMQADPRVSFEMDGEHALEPALDGNACRCAMNYESIVGYGTISILPDEYKKEALDCLMEHYHGTGTSFRYDENAMKHTQVYCLEVAQMTAKRR